MKEDPESLRQPFPRVDLRAVLDRWPGKFERGSRPRDHLWASQVGDCRRAVWTSWHRPQPHDDFFETHLGALGHAVEDMMAQVLAPITVRGGREVSFTTPKVSGRVDFVVRLHPDRAQMPLEVKSTYGFDQALAAPKFSHMYQLQWYLTQFPEAEHGVLAYVNLSNWGGNAGHWEALYIPRDDAKVAARVDVLWDDVHQAEPPGCENLEDPRGCWDCMKAEGKLARPGA